MTWKELEAMGVQRCCGMFTSGKRCRRRAVEGSSWCVKHKPMMESYIALNNVCSSCGKRFPVGGKCGCRMSKS